MDELPMTNLNHPNGVSRKFYDLMQEIEKLPASEQQTRCCIKTSEVQAFVLVELAKVTAERDGLKDAALAVRSHILMGVLGDDEAIWIQESPKLAEEIVKLDALLK